MPEPAHLQAARLRARFALRMPDALHLACAQHHRCAALWTNDGRLVQASHGLACNVLDDGD
jgi:predicted nucleic acid-binding protein